MKDCSILLKLISLLADGKYHSGRQCTDVLGINYAQIDKSIQVIRKWGINVFSIYGQGYCLFTPLQLLDEVAILTKLPVGRLTVLPVINSTNQYLIEHIAKLQPGDACVAEYQINGRGRHGRQWISPFGINIYLSIYWCLKHGVTSTIGLSLTIGIVIAETLHRFGAHGVRVKWPNDLYLNDRKLAGVLIEIVGVSSNTVHIVIGTGINLAMHESVIGKINQDWSNLQEAGIVVDRNVLTAELTEAIRQALWQFELNGFAPFVQRWQALDNFYNRPVKLLMGNRVIKGVSRGISAQGALVLEHEDRVCTYLSGEISLRKY